MLAACGPTKTAVPGPTPAPSTAGTAPVATGPTTSPTPSRIALNPKAVPVFTGNHTYTLPVPASRSPRFAAFVAVIREGVLWVTPPGFPDAQDHALSGWRVWLTPTGTPNGSLWQGARQLAVLSATYRSVSVDAVMSGNAVLSAQSPNGSLTPVVVTGANLSVQKLSSLPSQTPWIWGHGVIAWQSAPDTVTVDNLATGARATLSLTVNGTQPFFVVSGGLEVGSRFIPVSVIPDTPKPFLPAGYRWVSVAHSTAPVMAVPDGWTVTEEPGGSSQGVKAVNPKDPSQAAMAWDNACAACYLPTGDSSWVDSRNAPVVSAPKGVQMVWLSDNVVAYTASPQAALNPAASANGTVLSSQLPTYGLQEVTRGGGLDQVSVTVPAADKALATTILNSALAQFKAGPLS